MPYPAKEYANPAAELGLQQSYNGVTIELQ
jgi:hypothetical protein